MNVVALGDVLVDWLSLVPGQNIFSASEFHRGLGGNATNVAIGLTRLGTHVSLVGKIGTDFHGEFLKQALSKEGIRLEHLIVDGRYPTAQCYMTTTARGEHEYRNWPKPHSVDMLSPKELPLSLITACDVLHTTAISMSSNPRRQAVTKAIEVAAKSGAIVSFDGGLPDSSDSETRQAVEEALSNVHLLKLNESELRQLAGDKGADKMENLGRAVIERYRPKLLLITLSSDGSIIMTASDTIFCKPMKVKAVSEVGAGDAYIAGVIHALTELLKRKHRPRSHALSSLTAKQLLEVGLAGNVAGALTTTCPNAYEGMPTQSQLLKGLADLANHDGA